MIGDLGVATSNNFIGVSQIEFDQSEGRIFHENNINIYKHVIPTLLAVRGIAINGAGTPSYISDSRSPLGTPLVVSDTTVVSSPSSTFTWRSGKSPGNKTYCRFAIF